MGIREMKYVSKPILPDSPSISGSFSILKKIKKRTPIIIKTTPETIYKDFIFTLYFCNCKAIRLLSIIK